MPRFYVAMAAFAVLGLLAWGTLTDEKLRLATFLLLGMFALRAFLFHRTGNKG